MGRKLLFSLTAKDFRWNYYKGKGKGGQKKNKTENCCQCTHVESGASAKSEEGRSKDRNRRKAFRKMAETTEFQKWVRLESARVTGELREIELSIEKTLLKDTVVEIRVDDKWVRADEELNVYEGQ